MSNHSLVRDLLEEKNDNSKDELKENIEEYLKIAVNKDKFDFYMEKMSEYENKILEIMEERKLDYLDVGKYKIEAEKYIEDDKLEFDIVLKILRRHIGDVKTFKSILCDLSDNGLLSKKRLRLVRL